MAKTLKFALSALALVNGHKPREDVQHAYDQFLKDFGKSYDSVEKQVRARDQNGCCDELAIKQIFHYFLSFSNRRIQPTLIYLEE